ncbi:CDP-alcohol phosphatidyltransferase family protein [Alkalilimnicola sp. S0819]|uniref:CDP-alcohol phosphatidyltransferase family protein n=1 Tax=Alkalilimnicola sp. S0819 TaxID=2613922 RepID=UPI001261C9CF|nr:CDP-alcohol phosphatidyltransferase family protein [Alkalilimnicola sp. S0819]KAB7623209.1 CDP-alcohol phosphatidyltransferase family protein [Alkalilimnicola sp. S0819]MPQ17056.1 CDP-alcohol phosphatidyltransferase family protein [Alkalilimnicola sp. S0819]
MRLATLPNLISFARLLLVGPILWLMLQGRYQLALGLFLLAGLSDGLDGYLARRFAWQSRLGGFLDPLADKLLVTSSFVVLASQGLLPVALAVVVLLRDLVIVLGALAFYRLRGAFAAEPLPVSKLNTVLQLLVVLAVMLPPAWWWLAEPWRPEILRGLFLLTLATVVTSGVSYVLRWGRRAWPRRS